MLPLLLDALGGSPVGLVLALLLLAAAAGALGAILGLGGGLFLVPILVLLFGVDIHLAVAASLVSIIGTSLGSASTSVEEGQTDLRVGIFLETATSVLGQTPPLSSHGDVRGDIVMRS